MVHQNQSTRTITHVNNQNRKRWAIMLQIEVIFDGNNKFVAKKKDGTLMFMNMDGIFLDCF